MDDNLSQFNDISNLCRSYDSAISPKIRPQGSGGLVITGMPQEVFIPWALDWSSASSGYAEHFQFSRIRQTYYNHTRQNEAVGLELFREAIRNIRSEIIIITGISLSHDDLSICSFLRDIQQAPGGHPHYYVLIPSSGREDFYAGLCSFDENSLRNWCDNLDVSNVNPSYVPDSVIMQDLMHARKCLPGFSVNLIYEPAETIGYYILCTGRSTRLAYLPRKNKVELQKGDLPQSMIDILLAR